MNNTLICYPELPEGYEYRAFNDGMGFYLSTDKKRWGDIDILKGPRKKTSVLSDLVRAWAMEDGIARIRGIPQDSTVQFSSTQEALNWLAIQLWLGEIE